MGEGWDGGVNCGETSWPCITSVSPVIPVAELNHVIDQLAASIREAAAQRTPLRIVGGGTKDFYGGALRGETLATSAYRGIVEYDPTELVITARAGTPLAEIEGALREKRQMLAFEPPHFGFIPSPLNPRRVEQVPSVQPMDATPERASAPESRRAHVRLHGHIPINDMGPLLHASAHPLPKQPEAVASLTPNPSPGARGEHRAADTDRLDREGNVVSAMPADRMATLGGCVAAGLSGPRRACAGAVRDFVLGVRMLDGNGRDLHFGGRVMKNVAGYDVSRLMAGSLGTLGLILEASLKVLPLPAAEATLHLKCAEAEALALMNEWAGKPLPITATAFRNDDLGVRLSGAGAAVEAAAKRIGGTRVDTMLAGSFWNGIREQTDAYFSDARPLWRLSVKSTTPPLDLPGSQLIEWGGALRWLKTDAEARTIRETVARAGGHATLFRGGDKSAGVFQPLSAPLAKIHQRLKQSFDPAGIFNPGRMYPDF